MAAAGLAGVSCSRLDNSTERASPQAAEASKLSNCVRAQATANKIKSESGFAGRKPDGESAERAEARKQSGKISSLECGATFVRAASSAASSNQSRYQQPRSEHQESSTQTAPGAKPLDAASQSESGKLEPSERGKQNQSGQLGAKPASRARRLGELAARAMSSRHQQQQHQQLRHQQQIHEQRLLHEQQAAHSARQQQQSGAKLVSEGRERSPLRLKQHQPHCIHHHNLHKPHCAVLKSNQAGTAAKTLAAASLIDEGFASRDGAALPSNEPKLAKLAAPKYLKAADKSYLLVQYGGQQQQQQQQTPARLARGRTHESDASQQPANCNNGPTVANKRTTIKFISQLYFLLHLSAILSLISHHKNLVTSERKLDMQTAAADELVSLVAHSKRQTNESEAQLEAHQSSTVGALDELPQPLMLLYQQQQQLAGANKRSPPGAQLISSVVVSPQPSGPLQAATEPSSNSSRLRHGRQAAPQSPPMQTRAQLAQPDILVRLVGHWHAKCALQYFLCYLLSSSITILICLRLARLCGWRVAGRHERPQAARPKRADSSLYGFYYRTRLDCTPVLIGSISLGLIQLIVIGLDIASNVDWLGDNRWPIYLPFLQFAFVSLLMQFILGRVAKNAEEEKQRNWRELRRSSSKEKKEKAALSINEQQQQQHQQRSRRHNNNNNNNNNELMAKCCSPFSGGLQNIALAHLLVTHILLWLMKLNSISLFQAIEQQQQQLSYQQHHRQQRGYPRTFEHNQQQPTNRFYSTLSPTSGGERDGAPQATGAYSSTTLPSLTRELGQQRANSEAEQRQSRAQLESILRRKSTPSSASTTAAPERGSSRAPDSAPEGQRAAGQPHSTPGEPAGQLPNSTREGAAAGDASAKNARSTNTSKQQPEATRTASELGAWLLASNQQAELLANLSGANSTPVTISKAQLLSLLSLAAKNERSLQEQLAGQQQQQRAAANGSRPLEAPLEVPTPAPKPALPKRMTAFRQTPRPSVLAATSTAPPFVQANNASVGPTKQRARVLVSHSTWDGAKEVPEAEIEERRRRAGLLKAQLAEQPGATTERPFPSVDSDPPTPSSVLGGRELEPLPALGVSSTTSSTTARPSLQADKKLDSSRRAAIAAPTSTGSKPEGAATPSSVNEAAEEAEAEEEEGPESDLDALLPPVPNYNDTHEEEPKREASQRQTTRPAEEALKLPPGKRLPEEPFAFNEAASSLNLTITPISVERLWPTEASSPAPESAAPSWNASSRASNESKEIAPEASALLSSYRHRRDEEAAARGQQQPSFADYLLPIVYQYHILIIAILFNMWLDSLRKSPAAEARGAGERRAASRPQLLAPREPQAASSSASELGSVLSRSSSTRGLIAIPIKSGASRSYALERVLRPKGGHQEQLRWRAAPLEVSEQLRRRSRSMDLLQQQSGASELELESTSSGLSRCNSLRSSSSERLLWIPSSQLHNNKCSPGNQQHRARRLANSCSTVGSTLDSLRSAGSLRVRHAHARHLRSAELAASRAQAAQWRHRAAARRSSPARQLEHSEAQQQASGPTNSVCSVFFGLLVVSGSLIVILLGVDLLSVLSQCLTQLTSILVCLLGLLLIWRAEARQKRHKQQQQPLALRSAAQQQLDARRGVAGYHRQCFHYLFLLAAYYCGISIALNLGRQHSMAQLFSQQVVAFIQRHLSSSPAMSANQLHWAAPIALTNYFYLFHLILALKGALLIVQVTLQTVLIRSSCQQVTRELRQIYTFLMFANLSLWAMEICEQQQHLQQRQEQELHFDAAGVAAAAAAGNLATPPGSANNESEQAFRLVTLDGFSRFAASIVTLSHLYHGLVFMQH